MSTKIDLKKLARLAKVKGNPKKDIPPIRGTGIHIGKKSKRDQEDVPDVSPIKKKPQTLANVKKRALTQAR